MALKSIVLNDLRAGDYFYQEAVKTLRANVQFSGKSNKVILLTSAFSNEGKSDISFHLAAEMANAGKRVLLIDADIRKSVFKSRYEIEENTDGLTQFLSDQVERVEDIIYKTNYDNLHMILSGPYAPNPTEMLGDTQFGNLIKATRQVYDYVFIDTAPLGTVVDAAVIGQYCDGAILVIESGAVSYRISQKVKSQLEKSGCRLLGAVLNKADIKSGKYYGKRYGKYYGKYAYYGHDE